MANLDLKDMGLSETHISEAALLDDCLFIARVSLQFGEIYHVLTERGEIQARTVGKLQHAAADPGELPAVGDWVLVDRLDNTGGEAMIRHRLSRKSAFVRKTAGTGNGCQVIAANIDTVFICSSLNNDFNLRRIERYLTAVWDSGAVPVILLTKSDLCDDLDSRLEEIRSVAAGVEVVVTSALTDDYQPIRDYLPKGITAAFVGSSGVGKSTLINKLVGSKILAIQGLRKDDRGRHTTTNRQMLLLPWGGAVIDTPGMREFQIFGADFTHSFADIEGLADGCRFQDCRHDSEPNCAVKQAVADGLLSLERLESYRKLQREVLFEERKRDMSAAQAEKQKIVDMMGSLNAHRNLQKWNRQNKKNKS